MDGNDALDSLLGDRLNQEPVVFRGYTDSELSLAIRTACLTFLPLGALIGLLFGNFGMGLALWHGWETARRDARFHLPPDLRSGAVVKIDDPHPENVYAFAEYIFQQLNYWPENGEKDYGAALYRLAAYLSPQFPNELKTDLAERGKRGELSERRRAIQDVPGAGYEESRVTVRGNGAWTAQLELHIDEQVRGMAVKSVDIRYPLRVIRLDVNPEINPWGLVLDGFDAPGPQRLQPTSSPAAEARR